MRLKSHAGQQYPLAEALEQEITTMYRAREQEREVRRQLAALPPRGGPRSSTSATVIIKPRSGRAPVRGNGCPHDELPPFVFLNACSRKARRLRFYGGCTPAIWSYSRLRRGPKFREIEQVDLLGLNVSATRTPHQSGGIGTCLTTRDVASCLATGNSPSRGADDHASSAPRFSMTRSLRRCSTPASVEGDLRIL